LIVAFAASDLLLLDKAINGLSRYCGRSDLSECRVEVQTNIPFSLLVAMPSLLALIGEVQIEEVAYRCICGGDLPIVDLRTTLVQKSNGVVLARGFRRLVPGLLLSPHVVVDPPNLAAHIRLCGSTFTFWHSCANPA
jgi:hypothetical protein